MSKYAHSIKNPHIVHYYLRRNIGGYRWWAYLCIGASSTTPSKSTRDVYEVSCLNCQRALRNRGLL